MSTAAIQSIIETRLKAFADANDVLVQFENIDFTPPNDAAYLQFYFLPAPTRSADLEGATDAHVGVAQVNVIGLPGGGRGATAAIADQIEALFPANLPMTDGTITVTVATPAGAGKGTPDNGRYFISVSFQYRSYF